MFAKAYKLKSNALLKGSDAKRFRVRVQQAYPDMTQAQMEELLPNKCSITMMRITTPTEFITTVYSVDKRPMFFETEDGKLAPTIYALWTVSDLLPYFKITPGVLPKISNGAALKSGGIVPEGYAMNIYGRIHENQLVAIRLTTNRSAVAVGSMLKSSDDGPITAGNGPAVKILHIFGDRLWGVEPAVVLKIPEPLTPPIRPSDFPPLGASHIKLREYIQGYKETTDESKSPEEPKEQQKAPKAVTPNDNLQEEDALGDDLRQLGITSNTNDDIDHAAVLKNAFMTVLKLRGKDLTLPLLTSTFYRYVGAEATTPIDLKKTTYKKLSNFLADMVKQGFITTREETRGVGKITAINFDHPELVNFIVDSKAIEDSREAAQQALFHSEMMELYLVTDEVVAFFTKVNYQRGEGLTSVQVKKLLREYVSKNNLAMSEQQKKFIKLDECLQKICERPEASLETVYHTLLSKMNHTYEMRTAKDVGKNKPLIQMSLATRSGNKKVTLISNIEAYGIIVPEFIKLCKQGAAASTTVVKVANQNREMLQIQGNQVRFLHTLLTEKYKIPPKQILGLELAKPLKKKK